MKKRCSRRVKGDLPRKQRLRDVTASFQEAENHGSREAGRLWNLGKARNESSSDLTDGTPPC
jgi:hypothetical protein